MNTFWKIYQEKLTEQVKKRPQEYACKPGQEAAYAAYIAAKFSGKPLRLISINTPTFKNTARALGVKPTYKAMEPLADAQ